MFTYTALVMLYLAFIGFRGEWVGRLLWPAVAVHAALALLLAKGLLGESHQLKLGAGLAFVRPRGLRSKSPVRVASRWCVHHRASSSISFHRNARKALLAPKKK